MIVDFQHHFTPHELMPKDLGWRKIVSYDEHGAPSFILHWMLFDLDEHIRMMDEAGIDVALLTSAAGMCADLNRSRLCNETAKKAERDYSGRFIGAAHANPLGGAPALRELARCKHELGFPGVVITSETNGLYLDAAEFEPFWAECARLGLFVFVHPALNPRARRGARFRDGAARTRQGRRGDPVRQRQQTVEAASKGGMTAPGEQRQTAVASNVIHAARCFSISCTGSLTKSLSISARSAARKLCE